MRGGLGVGGSGRSACLTEQVYQFPARGLDIGVDDGGVELPLGGQFDVCRPQSAVPLLGIDTRPFAIELSWEWLTTGLLPIWKPFLLGCLVMGLASAAAGYLLLGGIWHLTLVLEYRKRKDDGPAKASAAGKE